MANIKLTPAMTEPEARATQNSNNGFLDSELAFTYLMTPHLSAWDTPNDLNLITKTSIYTFDYTLSANCPCNYGTVLTLPSAWTVQIAIASDNAHIYTRTAYGTWRTI
jgi:hypothetical protein